ncbi:Protein-S-isoprenylcysteine O-methyltransferase [Abortiporus biennis]
MSLHIGSPILKVPLIILNALLYEKSLSPSTPPPSKSELDKFDADVNTRDGVPGFGGWLLRMRLIFCHTISACEVLIILANSLSDSSFLRFGSRLLPDSIGHPISITPIFLVGSIFIIIGTVIRVWCFSTLGRHFTLRLSILNDHKLITSGPYAIVRHPSYSSWFVVQTGTILTHVGRGSWLGGLMFVDSTYHQSGTFGRALGCFYILWQLHSIYVIISRISREDKVLRNVFKEEWDNWASVTKYRLIPGVY